MSKQVPTVCCLSVLYHVCEMDKRTTNKLSISTQFFSPFHVSSVTAIFNLFRRNSGDTRGRKQISLTCDDVSVRFIARINLIRFSYYTLYCWTKIIFFFTARYVVYLLMSPFFTAIPTIPFILLSLLSIYFTLDKVKYQCSRKLFRVPQLNYLHTLVKFRRNANFVWIFVGDNKYKR